MIRLVAAVDRHLGIAKKGVLPWYIPEDEKYFTDQTKSLGGHVLTGAETFRVTYHGPLKDRHNYILTHDTTPIPGATVVNDLEGFLKQFKEPDLWIAGGAAVFKQVIDLGYADMLYLTHIDADFGCDRFFPSFDKNTYTLSEQSEEREQNGFRFSYAVYTRHNRV